MSETSVRPSPSEVAALTNAVYWQSYLSRWQPDRPVPDARFLPQNIELFERFCALQTHFSHPHFEASPANPRLLPLLLESLGGPDELNRCSILALARPCPPLPTPLAPDHPTTRPLEDALQALPGPTAVPLPAPFDTLPFVGGWIGYLGYSLNRAFERLPDSPHSHPLAPAHPSPHAPAQAETPAGWLLPVEVALVYDHETGRAVLVACLPPQLDAATAWQRTQEHLEGLERLLRDLPPAHASASFALTGPLTSPFDETTYPNAVQQAIFSITSGDIFQVNLSQRFSAPFQGDSVELYRRLRLASPAPFAAHLQFDVEPPDEAPAAYLPSPSHRLALLSSTPERFLKVEPLTDGAWRLETRPIKGTQRRGRTPDEEMQLAAGLQVDRKERSEHVMIVDMARNDLGRLADPDSVQVESLLRVEAYPRVLHLVSTVSARRSAPWSLWTLLKATFPGASITGAPKIKAMEVIESLEKSPRGPYTGALGYISRCGRLDLAMTIRTLVLWQQTLFMQVGGGIVARSEPRRELDETLLKARGMREALGLQPDRIPSFEPPEPASGA